MDADGEREADARRARRALRTFRLVFYSLAAVAAVALVLARAGSGDAGAYTSLEGSTNQGHRFELQLDRRGRPRFFETLIDATCPGDEPWQVRWWPADSARVPFHVHGDRLEVLQTIEHDYADGQHGSAVLTMRARVDAGERTASGTIAFVESFDSPGRPSYACASPPVRFSARG